MNKRKPNNRKPFLIVLLNGLVVNTIKLGLGLALIFLSLVTLSSAELNISFSTKRPEIKKTMEGVQKYGEKAYKAFKIVKNIVK